MLSRWKNAIEKYLKTNPKLTSALFDLDKLLQADGDLVVIGDVNPNGRVVAAGNIYVLGRLKGIAHAGSNGNREGSYRGFLA